MSLVGLKMGFSTFRKRKSEKRRSLCWNQRLPGTRGETYINIIESKNKEIFHCKSLTPIVFSGLTEIPFSRPQGWSLVCRCHSTLSCDRQNTFFRGPRTVSWFNLIFLFNGLSSNPRFSLHNITYVLRNMKDIAKLRGSEDLWEVAKLHNRESSFPKVFG